MHHEPRHIRMYANMHTHNIGLHSDTAEVRLTADFCPNKSCPKDRLHLSSHLPVVEPSRRPGRGGFQREHWCFERLLRPQLLEHYPGSSARKACSDTWMTSFWRVIQREAGFWKALSRGSRPGEAVYSEAEMILMVCGEGGASWMPHL